MSNEGMNSVQATNPCRPSDVRKRPRFDVAALFAGGRELRLIHGDQEYCLRITRNNKLILTK